MASPVDVGLDSMDAHRGFADLLLTVYTVSHMGVLSDRLQPMFKLRHLQSGVRKLTFPYFGVCFVLGGGVRCRKMRNLAGRVCMHIVVFNSCGEENKYIHAYFCQKNMYYN